MLKELKSPQKDSAAWCSLSDKLQMAEVSIIQMLTNDVKEVQATRFPFHPSSLNS